MDRFAECEPRARVGGRRNVSEIIEAIYEAALDDSLWNGIVKDIAEISGGYGGALVLWDTANGYVPVAHNQGFPDKFWNEYAAHHIKDDPRAHAFIAHPEIEFYTDEMLVSAETKKTHEVFNLVRSNCDQRHGYGARIFSNNAYESTLILARSGNQDIAQQADLDMLCVFMPHLRRSISLARRIGERVSMAALDAMSFGVAILDKTGQVTYANRVMMQIAADGDGIRLSEAGLAIADVDEHQHFQNMVECTRRRMYVENPQGRTALRATRPSGKRPYSIVVCPFPRLDVVYPGFNQATLICVSDPAQMNYLSEDILSSMFNLSPAESRLAVNLVKYGSLTAAAQECNLTEGSARQYIKRVLAKTGAKGQVDLVALIMGSVRI